MSFARSAALVAVGIALAGGASAQDAARFTIRVQNISHGEVLKLSNGKSAPFVAAPVLWVIHSGSTNPIFVAGKPDEGAGLEQLAETGNPSRLVGALQVQAGDRAGGRGRHAGRCVSRRADSSGTGVRVRGHGPSRRDALDRVDVRPVQ